MILESPKCTSCTWFPNTNFILNKSKNKIKKKPRKEYNVVHLEQNSWYLDPFILFYFILFYIVLQVSFPCFLYSNQYIIIDSMWQNNKQNHGIFRKEKSRKEPLKRSLGRCSCCFLFSAKQMCIYHVLNSHLFFFFLLDFVLHRSLVFNKVSKLNFWFEKKKGYFFFWH